MDYLEIQIESPPQNFETISNLLFLYGIKTILEEDNSLKFYLPEEEWGTIENLDEELMSKGLTSKSGFHVRKFENKNWNEEWEKSIKPIDINNKIVIHTSWNSSEIENPEDKILIQIDPKMAFGTGHNETTRLVLELMQEFLNGNESSLLDYGCGTGILAIAGIKLGVDSAIAIDIDLEAIDNAREYTKANEAESKITFYQSNISEIEEDEFDIICANIISSVIKDNIDYMKSKLNKNGKLFLSGILIEEEAQIVDMLKTNDFLVKKILHKAEWLGIYANLNTN